MKPIIIAIVGPSGSGKTTMSKYLQDELNIPAIVSHTTRAPRGSEVHGQDYFFITDTAAYDPSQMLSRTSFAGCEYFGLREQIPAEGLCTYVVEEGGLISLMENRRDDYEVYAVQLTASVMSRMSRNILRGRISRDENRRQLPVMLFDAVIENDGSLDQFKEKIKNVIENVKRWQPQK